MIDTSDVIDAHDKELIEDVIRLYKTGFCRASYLMAWLCCVESFRTKFKTMAEKGDDKTIWERIKFIENSHKSADLDIVQEAYKADFINEVEKQKLEYFYKIRCIYGHPYEQSPNAIDCEHIIQSVIDISLSKKLLLGKTSIDSIFTKLKEQESFLNKDEEKIKEYFENLVERIEKYQYPYLLQILTDFYETVEKECEDSFSYVRIRIFIDVLIGKIGIQQVLQTIKQQEDFIYKTKNTALIIFARKDVFEHLDDHIKTIVFNELKANKDSLKLAVLMNEYVLSESQAEEIKNLINNEKLDLQYFDAKFVIHKLTEKLESLDFNKQNPAIYTLQSPHVRGTLKACEEEDLIILGRNILQSANHKNSCYSASAYDLLCNAEKLQSKYPSEVVKGIVAECFTNEKKKIIRSKINQIKEVEEIVKLYNHKKQKAIIDYTERLIDSFTFGEYYDSDWSKIDEDSIFYPLVTKIKEKSKNE
ncbi:hypothetical protein [uncultured Treponema sp.]|uniref:hypothetical protein n=1 Tax=uncultured Treponema sp. TaxID=162155 RepID=UPI0025EF76FD|nr:hypothetical protein [uncultured Treponema sp.]